MLRMTRHHYYHWVSQHSLQSEYALPRMMSSHVRTLGVEENHDACGLVSMHEMYGAGPEGQSLETLYCKVRNFRWRLNFAIFATITHSRI